jgi:hypothetical protein
MQTSCDCQFIEKCPMFQYFTTSAKHVYIQMYCKGNFERCKRRKLRVAGQAVPEGLLPYGGYLWEEKKARTVF